MPSLSESSVSHGLHSLTLLSDLVSEPELDADTVQSTVSKKGVMMVLASLRARPRSLDCLVMREDSGSIFSPEEWYLDGSAHQSPDRKRGH